MLLKKKRNAKLQTSRFRVGHDCFNVCVFLPSENPAEPGSGLDGLSDVLGLPVKIKRAESERLRSSSVFAAQQKRRSV